MPLIEKLQFITNKKSWGYPFRFGIFEIKEDDFNLIASEMLTNPEKPIIAEVKPAKYMEIKEETFSIGV